MGANGKINDLTLAIVAVAPGGAPVILARLGSELEVTTTIPSKGAPIYATLYWKDGVIEGEVTIAGQLESYGDRVEVYGARIASFGLGLNARTHRRHRVKAASQCEQIGRGAPFQLQLDLRDGCAPIVRDCLTTIDHQLDR